VDANEVDEAWEYHGEENMIPCGAHVEVVKRSDMGPFKFAPHSVFGNGAYVLSDARGKPNVLLIVQGAGLACVERRRR